MDIKANRIPLLIIAAVVALSLGVGLIPNLQPPTWHSAVTAVVAKKGFVLLDRQSPKESAAVSEHLVAFGHSSVGE